LREKARRRKAGNKAEIADRALAQAVHDDAGIAALNMTGIQSFAMELKAIVNNLRKRGIVASRDSDELPFKGIDIKALKRAALLIDSRYARHMVVCRNVLYMALQAGDIPLANKMAAHIAKERKIPQAAVWTTEICGRPPLAQETALQGLIPRPDSVK
jgi:hypothetical protein